MCVLLMRRREIATRPQRSLKALIRITQLEEDDSINVYFCHHPLRAVNIVTGEKRTGRKRVITRKLGQQSTDFPY